MCAVCVTICLLWVKQQLVKTTLGRYHNRSASALKLQTLFKLKPQTSNDYLALIIWKAFQLADVEMQVELHNKAMHGQPPSLRHSTKLGPHWRTCEKRQTHKLCVCARAPVGQSCTSGPDRPLSQLLPDLQLNQHGFSRAWYFSSATQNNIPGRAPDHSRFS